VLEADQCVITDEDVTCDDWVNCVSLTTVHVIADRRLQLIYTSPDRIEIIRSAVVTA